jgi:hypothetical protein
VAWPGASTPFQTGLSQGQFCDRNYKQGNSPAEGLGCSTGRELGLGIRKRDGAAGAEAKRVLWVKGEGDYSPQTSEALMAFKAQKYPTGRGRGKGRKRWSAIVFVCLC